MWIKIDPTKLKPVPSPEKVLAALMGAHGRVKMDMGMKDLAAEEVASGSEAATEAAAGSAGPDADSEAADTDTGAPAAPASPAGSLWTPSPLGQAV